MTKAAKRRKREEDEAFEIPEFDEVAYMEKEVNVAKASFVMIALAIPLAVALYALTVAGLWGLGFLAAFAITYSLPRIFKFVPWPKVDLSKFERRDWIGHGGTFFLTWLAFWILLINVPFTDLTPPVIAAVYVNGVPMVEGSQRTVNAGSSPVYINATVFENMDLRSVQFSPPSGGPLDLGQNSANPRAWSVLWPTPTSGNTLEVVATDLGGRATTFTFGLNLT